MNVVYFCIPVALLLLSVAISVVLVRRGRPVKKVMATDSSSSATGMQKYTTFIR